ncbi:DUF5320 domain-containing protein [Moorella naiadis (nom. illeg.)]|uniref:DUF5320 domain-containing protein n=1 Tax=Moorella naiadis (nom. illeg.) TaxID=3093670 RepID=UPI003D9C82B0
MNIRPKGGVKMPRGDRTGPWGLGPRTGRGAGYCNGFPVPGFMNPAFGFGRGLGRGRGLGLGLGRRWGLGFFPPSYGWWGVPFPGAVYRPRARRLIWNF